MGVILDMQQVEDLFNQRRDPDGKDDVENDVLKVLLLDTFDSFPYQRLTKSLYSSLVQALFSVAPARLSLSQFSSIYNVVRCKLEQGEPNLGKY